MARIDGVESRPGPQVERLLRWWVVAFGDPKRLEGNAQGDERLAGECRAADEGAYVPAAAALVAGEKVVVEDALE